MHLLKMIAFVMFGVGFLGQTAFAGGDRHGRHEGEEHEEAPEGPHGGRWLEENNIGLELAIIEQGIPPQFRAWIYRDGELIDNADAQLWVQLARLGGETDTFEFNREEDYWMGNGVVEEPHSFDVTATLTLEGEKYQWSWESYEGRTSISPAMAQQVGIETAIAGPGTIRRTLTTYGRLTAAPGNVSQVQARFPGEIVRIAAGIGDTVKAGELLAEVESNESLRKYAITSPINGVVTQRDANLGEITGERVLFTVADFDPLWAELKIFPSQRPQVGAGQPVLIATDNLLQKTAIQALVPGDGAPFVTARAELDNSEGNWAPGLLVEGQIVVENVKVPLAVDNRALQRFRDWTVVFIQMGDTYEIRPLELGRSDGEFTEVIAGLKTGDAYVVENSYLIKADIEKSGASHAH
jgi:cobalt-zinc-cadmium efflux system membrane fusion protein